MLNTIKAVEIDLEQGSDEWIDHRHSHKNASELAAAMNIHPNIKRNQLIRVRATGKEIEYSDFVKNVLFPNGHKIEKMIRPLVEQRTGEDFIPKCFEYGEYACSLDGQTILGDVNLEIKQFNKDKYESVKNGVVPDYDLPQVMQGLWITGAQKTIYAVANPDGTDYVSVDVFPDVEFFADIPRIWEKFESDANSFTEFDQVEFIAGSEPDSLVPVVNFRGGGISVTSNIAHWMASKKSEYEKLPVEITADNIGEYSVIGDNMESARVLIDELYKRIVSDSAPITDMIADLKEASKFLGKAANHCKNTLADYRRNVRQIECDKASTSFIQYLGEANAKLGGAVSIDVACPDFMAACNRTRNYESLASAIGATLSEAMIKVDKVGEDYAEKLAWCKENAACHIALFPDLQQIISKPLEDFTLTITSRIEKAKADEAAKLEAQRQQIEAEAKAKAEAEAAAKIAAEEARIRAEERAKANEEANARHTKTVDASDPVAFDAANPGDTITFGGGADSPVSEVVQPIDSNVVVIQHQDDISAFMASRDFGKETGKIRAVLVEFIKFTAARG